MQEHEKSLYSLLVMGALIAIGHVVSGDDNWPVVDCGGGGVRVGLADC